MLVQRGSDASPRCTKTTEHLQGLCVLCSPKPALLSWASGQSPREHRMSAPEWEGATDCYLSLPALSSPEIKNQLNKITLLLYTEMCGIKGTHIYKHEEEGDVCKVPLLTLSLQCFPLNLKQIFRVKSPEQAEEQPKKSGTQPLHYSSIGGGRGGNGHGLTF